MNLDERQDKRYTDREVRAILARVGELQVKKASDASSSGTTLRQLQQATAELGLDTGLLQRAVDELDTQTAGGGRRSLLGGPWTLSSDKIVPGSVDVQTWPSVVEDIRSKTGRIGNPKVSGTLFEWTSEQPDGLHVSISPSGENSRVRVTAQFGGIALMMQFLGTVFGFMFGAMIGSSLGPAHGHSLMGMLSIIAALAIGSFVGFAVGRLATIPYTEKKHRATRDFMAFLERRVSREETQLESPIAFVSEVEEQHLSVGN